MKSIKIDELEKISKRIFDKLKSGKINEISLDEDYYWYIPTDKKYKLNDRPEPITGSLVDD